jgi:hypothetical protein
MVKTDREIDSRYNLQTGGVPAAGNPGPGGQPDHTKRIHPHPHNRRYNNMMTPAQSGTQLQAEIQRKS